MNSDNNDLKIMAMMMLMAMMMIIAISNDDLGEDDHDNDNHSVTHHHFVQRGPYPPLHRHPLMQDYPYQHFGLAALVCL